MSSKISSFCSLDNKDVESDSENNDYQVKNQNFINSSPPIYSIQTHTTNENGQFLNNNCLKSSLLIDNINKKKEYNFLNSKITKTTEVKINDNNILSPDTIKNNCLFNLNNSSTNVVNTNKKLKNDLFLGKKYGRKKKGDNNIGVHNKYSNDNIRRKIKHLVLRSFVSFFNEKIKIIYNGDIGKNVLKKELLSLNKEVKCETSVKFNRNLLKRTLKDIYSDNISTRFTNFPKEHNINLIQQLLNEKDEEKRYYFIKLFNLTFLDCLNHFRGTDFIEELNGMKCFNEIQKEFDDDQEYKTVLEYHINNFDKTLKIIKPRKRKRMEKIEKME